MIALIRMVAQENKQVIKDGKKVPVVAVLLLLSAIVAGISILFKNFNLIFVLFNKHERLRIDEVLTALVILSVPLNIYLFHRYNRKARQLQSYRKTEKALRLSNEKFTKAFRSCPDWLIISTLEEGRLIEVNETFLSESGYTRKEVIGKTKSELGIWLDIGERKRIVDILKQHGRINNLELCIRIKSGEIRRMLWSAELIELEGQTCIIAVNRDITKQKTLEARLRQAQHMEAIGTLTGGIAHDFNNILSPIIGFTELALDEVKKGTPLEDSLQEVYSAGKRAKELVKQILTFARQSNEEKSPIQPARIVKEVLKFIRSAIPSTIAIQQEIASDALIMGEATQMHQVLMNLCTNAAQAMEDTGGVLKVRLKEVVIDKKHASRQMGLAQGDYVAITVSDTGVGIAPDILGSIFEPYFTTKRPGEGTGMGLAMVHGIVESYGGKINVESQLGLGTAFTIYLPVTGKRKVDATFAPEQLPSGEERILFVDDELTLTKMSAQILERLGYAVTIRTSSIEALKLFRAKPDAFDLVITDMTMPNMTGDELAIELMKIRPDIPVILSTGYSKKMSRETALGIGIKTFANKPMVKADLAKTVRKVLDDAKAKSCAKSG